MRKLILLLLLLPIFASAQTIPDSTRQTGGTSVTPQFNVKRTTSAATTTLQWQDASTGKYYGIYSALQSDLRYMPIGGGGGYVPTTRTLTINGTTYDLSANRTWTIATIPDTSHTSNGLATWPYIQRFLTQANAGSTYVSLTGSYSNPSWITGLAWSKITGAPTSFPTPNAVTFNNSGAGATSGAAFDGSTAKTISYNTIGAQAALGYTPENVANKTTTYTTINNTLYPTIKLVSDSTLHPNKNLSDIVNPSIALTNLGGLSFKNATPQRVTYIYAMGDSQTANGVYIQRIDTLLGNKWYVVNKGIQGQTTANFLSRFTTDVLNNSDASYVIILGGVNDAVSGVYASTTIANLQSMYTQAHTAGKKVIACTILPFKGYVSWTSGKQAVIDSVNNYIRNTATNIDYKVDTYAAFNDPAHPGQMLPQYLGTSPDYLHPNLAGYSFLGTTIYNGVTWVENTGNYVLGISKDVIINQNLRTNDAPTFRDLNLVTQQPSYGGGVLGGGNLYMPSSTSTTGLIYNNSLPVIQFPGTGNVQIGYSDVASSGSYNFKGGHEAGNGIGSGMGNTAIGAFSFYGRSTADYGVAVGYQAGFSNNSLRSVFVGPQAGYYETGGSKLFIDNTQRASESDARVKAMIYGVFDANPAIQELHFNAMTFVNGNFSANNISGAGSGITSITAANISAGTAGINISGNAATVTDGVYTTTFNALGDARYLQKSNNLSDLASPSTARTNLGLGSYATRSSGLAELTGADFGGDVIVTGTNNTTNWFSAIKLHRFGSSVDFLTISTKDRTLGNSPVYFNDGNGNGFELASAGSTKMTLSTSGALGLLTTQTTVNGSTSGSIVCSMPFQGSSYKKVLIYVNNLTSTALTYTYPVAFTFNPMLSFATTGTVSPTSDATHITISGSGGGGWITLEGY